jgi:hypothetical protein
MRTSALRLLPLILAGAFTHPALADFKVRNASPFIEDRVVHVDTQFDLTLNPKTEEALSKGIPLEVVFDINLVKHRWWWVNKVITDSTFRRRIFFHALSRQFLVTGLRDSDPTESFSSLSQALVYMGDLSELTMPLTAKKQFEPDSSYLITMRARLDIEALPTLMRPLAYATPSWHLSTGWKEWPVQP